jgi:kinetochore protein Nuf2
MLFRQQRAPTTEKHLKKFDETVEREAQLDYEIQQLEQQIATIKRERAAEGPQVKAIGEKAGTLATELRAVLETSMEWQASIDEAKKEKAALIESLSTNHQQIQEMNHIITNLRAQVVQSPERLKQRIVDMGLNAEAERANLQTADNKVRTLQAKLDQLANIERDIRELLEAARILDAEMDRLKLANDQLRERQKEIDKKAIESRELETQHEQLVRQLENAKDRLERAKKHGQEKREASSQKMERLMAQYEEIAAERKEKEREQQSLLKETQQLETKIAEYIKEQQAEINQLLAENSELRQAVIDYMDTLSTKLALKLPSANGPRKQKVRRKKSRV